jgi:dihydroneopterin aldolase
VSDHIVVQGIKGFGYHGVFEEERAKGQDFIVDLDVETDFSVAVTSDDVSSTLNYATLADVAYQAIIGTPFNLIETLADDIAQKIISRAMVISVEVTVHKPYAPIDVAFKDVAVTRRLP